MRNKVVQSFLAALCLGILLAASAYLYKHRSRVDEFGRPISIHPGNAKVSAGAGATLEDAAARRRLPEYQDVPAASASELTLTPVLSEAALNLASLPASHGDWARSQADAAGTRYSLLDQINKTNVTRLQPAWIFHSNDGKANVQCTPVIVGGILYAPTAGNHMVALNAATGAELWRFHPGGHPAQRGLIYWPGTPSVAPRLFFTSGAYLFALDPKTGTPVASFGKGGKVASGGVVAPVIYQNLVITANFNVMTGFDVFSGRLLWTFDVLPASSNPNPNAEDDRGGNIWGGMALDAGRGIVFAATGSPHPNFIGIEHTGENKNANCVLALDAKTGKLLWSFQEIRHDIWDLDLPAAPNLVTVIHGGKRVDAVAEVTKLGNTLLLDRLTGRTLFPYRLRRAPVSTLPGERTSPYQPVFAFPQPFTRQEFQLSDITDLSPQAHAFVEQQVRKANYGWFQPFEPGKPTVYYNVHGGAQWTGAAFDPSTGWLFVNANEIPWIPTVLRARAGASNQHAPSAGESVYRQNCAGCHGVNRKGKGMAPSLLGLPNRMIDDEAVRIVQYGRNAMPAIAVPADRRQKLIDFLFDRDVPVDNSPVTAQTRWEYFPNGYPKLLDDAGYPGTKPPWGTLNAIDLSTGRIAWKVPLGEYEELTRKGIPKTGTENFGGATVTAGGLVFCGGTRDRKIRAFDKDSGRELWAFQLPFGGFAPPATYLAGGRQYVVIAATGGGKLGGAVGDTYVAFALPAGYPPAPLMAGRQTP